jgi:lipoprotein-anchoring transpeptidase ErfK/SrfK
LMLSSNRDQSGLLIARDTSTGRVLGYFEALARGSQGPGDTQTEVNGNTPTGNYRVTTIENTSTWNQNSYGPNGALRLLPISGNARAAEQLAGREGLLIHGGSIGNQGYWRGANELRATHGCVRLRNEDMQRLGQVLYDAANDPLAQQSREIEVTLTVADYQMSIMRP